jgi:hypothetical protein
LELEALVCLQEMATPVVQVHFQILLAHPEVPVEW